MTKSYILALIITPLMMLLIDIFVSPALMALIHRHDAETG